MIIRPALPGESRTAACLHASSITEGFLPRLGPRFLSRLYGRIVRDERSFLLVAEDHGTINGMIAGTEDVRALYRRFARRDGIVAAALSAPALVKNAASVVETWRYGGGQGDDLPPAELLAIAIDDGAREHGLGRALVTALQNEFSARRIANVKVVVVAGNEPALALYRSTGFHETATIEVHRDVTSKVLVWSPSSP